MTKQKTEYQVVLSEGGVDTDVLTGLTKKEAFEEYKSNKNAVELKKVVWKAVYYNDGTQVPFEDEAERTEETIAWVGSRHGDREAV